MGMTTRAGSSLRTTYIYTSSIPVFLFPKAAHEMSHNHSYEKRDGVIRHGRRHCSVWGANNAAYEIALILRAKRRCSYTCYNNRTMNRWLRWAFYGLVLAFLLGAGIWGRSLFLEYPMATPDEAPHLLAAATLGEAISSAQWPDELVAQPSPFHMLAAPSARFVATRRISARCYRIFPIALSALLLPLMLLLGIRSKNGLLERQDGILWAIAFTAFSPELVSRSWTFAPFSQMAFLFLGILLAARFYVQWPGFVAAACLGGLWGLSVATSPNVCWLLLLAIPAVIIGTGWSRLKLYWHTLHVTLAFFVGADVWGMLHRAGLAAFPDMPKTPRYFVSNIFQTNELFEMILFGIGLVAWAHLLIWSWHRPGRRWARFLALLTLMAVVCVAFWGLDDAFLAPLAVLLPLLLAQAIETLRVDYGRWILGNVVLMALGALSLLATIRDQVARPAYESQKAACLALEEAVREEDGLPDALLVVATERSDVCAQVLWPIRGNVQRVQFGKTPPFAHADLAVVPEEQPMPSPQAEWNPCGEVILPFGGRGRQILYIPHPRVKETP